MGLFGGDNNQTVKQKMEPWGPSQWFLEKGLNRANDLFNGGDLVPFTEFSGATNKSHDMIRKQAMGPQLTAQSESLLGRMMNPNWQTKQLRGVQDYALSQAIPAATSMFEGSGMANSGQAMDYVGRAATDAVSPYAYDAFNQAQDRSMQAAGMAPAIDAAGYLPAQMMGQLGGALEGKKMERMGNPAANLNSFLNMAMGAGGMGSSGSSMTSGGGVNPMAQVAGAGLGGLGMYGALAANPVTAPFAIGGGIASGLLGLFK